MNFRVLTVNLPAAMKAIPICWRVPSFWSQKRRVNFLYHHENFAFAETPAVCLAGNEKISGGGVMKTAT